MPRRIRRTNRKNSKRLNSKRRSKVANRRRSTKRRNTMRKNTMKRRNTSRNFRGGRFLGKDAKKVSGLKNLAGNNYVVGPMGNVRLFSDSAADQNSFEPEIYGDWVHSGYYSRELGSQHQFADMRTKMWNSSKQHLEQVEVTYTKPGPLGLLFGKKNAYYPMLSKALPQKNAEVEDELNRLNTLMSTEGLNADINLIKLKAGDKSIENPTFDVFKNNTKVRPLTLTFESERYNKPHIMSIKALNTAGPAVEYDYSIVGVKQPFTEKTPDPMNAFASNKRVGFAGPVDPQTLGYSETPSKIK